MSLNNLDTMGAIGESAALLGIALLWTCRVQAADWLREFLEIWRGGVSGRDPLLSDPVYRRQKPRRPRGALLLVGAVALVFVGQILLLLDLTF
jgi:hypothetical protein